MTPSTLTYNTYHEQGRERVEQIRLVLEGALTLRTIDTVRADLMAGLAQHGAIIADCSGATETDVSLVQLLLAARASAARDGRRFALARPVGEALLATLRRGGFLSGDPAQPGRDDDFWHGQEDRQ